MSQAVSDEVKDEESGKQLELLEHLSEVRARLMRCIVYAALGTVAGWSFYGFFFKLLSAPVLPFLKKMESSFLLTGIAEGFTIKMQVSLLIGLALALPFITLEGWRFVSPGLTRRERRSARLIAPLSVVLFISGVVLAYHVLPVGIKWLISQNPPEAKFMPTVQQSLLFILKMYLAFGVVFQMPVLLMFLARVGLVNSRMLKSGWRHAIIAIGIVAAAITPSGDAITMSMMCVPMIVLYLLSIGLVRIVEK